MMPDNESPGDLESFLGEIRSVAEPQPVLWQKARSALDQLTPGDRLFKPKDEHKAAIRTWLAWQKEPGAPYGLAVNLDCFDLSHPLAARFTEWFKRLRA